MTSGKRARQEEKRKPPRRHHLTPKVCLSGWADEQGRVHVIQPATGKLYRASLDKVAVEKDFYTLFLPDGRRRAAVEEAMAEIEGAAATDLGEVRAGTWPLPFEHRYALGKLIALQIGRTPEFRGVIERMTKQAKAISEALRATEEQSPDAAKDGADRASESAVPSPEPPDGPVATSGELLDSLWTLPAAHLDASSDLAKMATSMTWTLANATEGGFLTSDQPVCFWPNPDEPGPVGLATAEDNLPDLQAALPGDQASTEEEVDLPMAERSRRRQITAEELVAINRATADHAHRVVIVHVDQQVSDINPPSAFTVARHDRRN